MFMPTSALKLTVPCKECRQPVEDGENNGYRLIEGILCGWCNDCFDKSRPVGKRRITSAPPAEPVTAGSVPDGR
jgi:hypothetical protein